MLRSSSTCICPATSRVNARIERMHCSRDMVLSVLSALADAGFEGQVVSEVGVGFQNQYDLAMDVLLVRGWQHARAESSAPLDTTMCS